MKIPGNPRGSICVWCRLAESNHQPTDYDSVALPIELRRRSPHNINLLPIGNKFKIAHFAPFLEEGEPGGYLANFFLTKRTKTAISWARSGVKASKKT